MLRLNKGITSSGEIFWLIPAMRRNERRGPGITNSDEDAMEAPSGAEVAVDLSRLIAAVLAGSSALADKDRVKRESATRTDKQKRGFKAGGPLKKREEADRSPGS